MTKFTRYQYTQLIVFCLYWFVFFPLIWFVVKPDIFIASIWFALLFAIILLLAYCLLYFIIKQCWCHRQNSKSNGHEHLWPPTTRSHHNPSVYNPTTSQDRGEPRETRVLMPDTVMYENPMPRKKPGLICQDEPLDIEMEEPKNVRFITSCSLYYDGQNFK